MSDEKKKTESLNNEALTDNVIQDEAAIDTDDSPNENHEEETVAQDFPANDSDTSARDSDIPSNSNDYSDAIDNLFGESENDDITEEEKGENTDTEDAIDAESSEDPSDTEDAASDTSENTDNEDLNEFDDEVKAPEKVRKVDSLFDFIEIFVFTLAAVFIITSFFFRYSIVDGPSMQNTLQHGDKLILTNFMYEPECGDVIVVHSDALNKVIVKRVIATEGQTVKITSTDVYVDGEKLSEDYVYTDDHTNILGYKTEYKYLPEGDVFEMTVPEGEIFVMGDHRNKSEDSRSIGTISEKAVIGKVVLRFAPFDSFGKID